MAVMLTFALVWPARRLATWPFCLTLDLALDPLMLLFPSLLSLLAATFDLSVTTTPILPCCKDDGKSGCILYALPTTLKSPITYLRKSFSVFLALV